MLNYRVIGDGYPVVFLHGFLESNTMWNTITPGLNGVKCILIELPGHGKSNFPSEAPHPTLDRISEMVFALIETLGLKNFALTGHSLGGYVALGMYRKKPDEINKLILLNSHPWEDSDIKKAERTQVARIVKKNKSLFLREAIPNLFYRPELHRENIKNLIHEALEIEAEAIAGTVLAMRDRSDYISAMTQLGNKCLVIQGKFDKLIPYDKMKSFTAGTNNVFHLIENAGHMSHLEATEEVCKVLKNFILPERNK